MSESLGEESRLYVLGVDQGGSKTAALLVDDTGAVWGSGRSAGAVHSADGMDAAIRAVLGACGQALATAGIGMERVSMLVAAMSGADWPYEYDLLRSALERNTGRRRILVVNDCIAAFRGGTASRHGAVLCAGSGLNAAILDPSGATFVYGYHVEDEDQGAGALGAQGLRAAISAGVGLVEPTCLTRTAQSFFGESGTEELLQRLSAGGIPLDRIRGFAPLLLQAADDGDPVARRIVSSFGSRIARYVTAGLSRFGMADSPVEVVLSGSLFKPPGQLLADTAAAAIHVSAPRAVIAGACYEPVVGSARMALEESTGTVLRREVRERMDAGCTIHGLRRSDR